MGGGGDGEGETERSITDILPLSSDDKTFGMKSGVTDDRSERNKRPWTLQAENRSSSFSLVFFVSTLRLM